MQTAHFFRIGTTGTTLRRPGPLALLREYLEFRRDSRQLLRLSASQRADIGVTRDEVEQAAAGFAAWRASRFGRGRDAATAVLLTALLG